MEPGVVQFNASMAPAVKGQHQQSSSLSMLQNSSHQQLELAAQGKGSANTSTTITVH